MIYYGIFIASDPTMNDEERDETEDRLHLLVTAASLPWAQTAFKTKIHQLWDNESVKPRFTQIHPVQIAEMHEAPTSPVCLYCSVEGSAAGLPIQKLIHEPGVDCFEAEPEHDGSIPVFLDRLIEVPAVKWVRL